MSSSGMLRGVGWCHTDVSELRNPEISVRKQPTPPNIPEDDKIQVKQQRKPSISHL